MPLSESEAAEIKNHVCALVTAEIKKANAKPGFSAGLNAIEWGNRLAQKALAYIADPTAENKWEYDFAVVDTVV